MSTRDASLLGKKMVQQLFVLNRVIGQYPEGHPALKSTLAEMTKILSGIGEEGREATLAVRESFLYLGDQRLKPDTGNFEAFAHVVRRMNAFGLGSVTFDVPVPELSVEKFLRLLGRAAEEDPGDAFDDFEEALFAEGAAGVSVTKAMEGRAGGEKEGAPAREGEEAGEEAGAEGAGKGGAEGKSERERKRARTSYTRALAVISTVMSETTTKRRLRFRRAKRVVQGLVDIIEKAESTLLGLTTLHSYDEYTYYHSVNVCILSLALGQKIGLGRNALLDLGLSALLHDLGKALVPLEILNKPGRLDEDEMEVMQMHPVLGLKELMRLKGEEVLNSRMFIGAFEHHQKYDRSGYPGVPSYRGQSLFGRIIAVADCFDAMTSSRVYCKKPLPPQEALKLILKMSGEHFDPIIVKHFVNTVGMLPVGTLCRLSDGGLAVVTKGNAEQDRWECPVVKLIAGADGVATDGPTVDLAADGEQRRVVGTLDAGDYGINVAACLV